MEQLSGHMQSRIANSSNRQRVGDFTITDVCCNESILFRMVVIVVVVLHLFGRFWDEPNSVASAFDSKVRSLADAWISIT